MKYKLLIAYIFLLLTIPVLTATAQNEPFKVSVSTANKDIHAGTGFDLDVNFKIAPEHFLYKDKVRVEIEPIEGFIIGKAVYPKAVVKHDQFLEKDIEIYKKNVTLSQKITISEGVIPGKLELKMKVFYQGCKAETCFFPKSKDVVFAINVLAVDNSSAQTVNNVDGDESDATKSSFEKTIERRGLFGALIFAFIAGIGVSFTPCIYPMIPITVAIVGGQTGNKPIRGFYLSLVYVLGISVVYSALGVVAASTGALFGSAVNSPWVVGVVAFIFTALAFSMFGVYELQLPTGMAEKFGGKKKGSGIIGIFFMGLISGTVASPCVGPVLVSLLVFIASSGSKVLGFWLLFVFSWGMGLLLIAVGTFSGALNVLPKSGAWMVMIKKILGLLLLGAAFYYIKGIVPETIFVVSFGVFLITVGIFSGGLDRLVTESTVLLRVKKSFGILCIIFGIYFLVGTLLMKGLILGPLTFSQPNGNNDQSNIAAKSNGSKIEWLVSESEGVQLAKENSKPVMIDFWAEWCSVCKKLEKKTLYDADVIKKSKNFVNIKVDCTNVDDPEIKGLWSKYGIVGLPTIIFIDKNGVVLRNKSVIGFVNPSKFMQIMDSVL